jgi:hypothetical protein
MHYYVSHELLLTRPSICLPVGPDKLRLGCEFCMRTQPKGLRPGSLIGKETCALGVFSTPQLTEATIHPQPHTCHCLQAKKGMSRHARKSLYIRLRAFIQGQGPKISASAVQLKVTEASTRRHVTHQALESKCDLTPSSATQHICSGG